MLNSIGTEHIVTRAYNARCTGQVERNNQTISYIIRIIADSHGENWPLFVPFAQFSYNTKIHKTTGMSPFFVIFGVYPNEYTDYVENPTLQKEAEILQRTIQLANLDENLRPLVKTNIEKAQETQKINQNKQNNVLLNALPLGTVVYIKNEGLLNKLDPRFRGPYKVVGVSERQNYYLEDSLGGKLVDVYPLHKLKIADHELIMEMDVEKIVSHKMLNNSFSYLVKWVDNNKKKSWITEEKLKDKYEKLILDYKSSLKGGSKL